MFGFVFVVVEDVAKAITLESNERVLAVSFVSISTLLRDEISHAAIGAVVALVGVASVLRPRGHRDSRARGL